MESTYFDSNEQISLEPKLTLKLKSKSTTSETTTFSSSDDGCFDCNICLEPAHDPVVTLCGHLYCWPCIYKWIRVQSSPVDLEPEQQPSCPVCKAAISHTSLVPLYGRGASNSESESKKLRLGLGIPQRPSPYNSLNAMVMSTRSSTSHHAQQLHPSYFHSQSRPLHYQQYFGHRDIGLPDLGGAATNSFFNPMIGMFGEMVLTRIFGVSDANLIPYHHHYVSGNPRMRRQEMQINKSLNRVSIFLLCCIILCLLLF